MKELYLDAEMELVTFSASDIITTSGGSGGSAEETTPEWEISENEGPPDYAAWG